MVTPSRMAGELTPHRTKMRVSAIYEMFERKCSVCEIMPGVNRDFPAPRHHGATSWQTKIAMSASGVDCLQALPAPSKDDWIDRIHTPRTESTAGERVTYRTTGNRAQRQQLREHQTL